MVINPIVFNSYIYIYIFFFSSPYTSGIEGLGGFILLDLLLYPVSALFQWRVSTFKMRDAAEFAIILT